MKLQPRDYQQAAHDAAIDWIKRCTDSALIEAATGAGKSIIIAMVAESVVKMSGKKVLVTAPSSELVTQNRSKYLLTGSSASIFSASAGGKCMRHDVVFGTPGTISNSIAKFGSQFALIIMDEAHGITPTMIKIIEHIKDKNPNVRVLGLSATPYRLGSGYIYGHADGKDMPDECAIDPFFHTRIFDIGARDLIDRGFLTPPVFDDHVEGYDTSGLKMNSTGQWDKSTIDQAFVGRGRKTAGIVADVVQRCQSRRGVMFFAATVEHAEEVMESLPPAMSAIVTGKTPKAERNRIIEAFKAQEIKYLVSVSTLTTGFDSPHVDAIAILRATESVALFQQIVGRSLRLYEGKHDALILDYGDNMERHCPEGDIFAPEIKARRAAIANPMQVSCPLCGHVNEFGARKNEEGYNVDNEGYFADLTGAKIEIEEGTYYPAHYGRRCRGEVLVAGKHQQCGYHWSFKECEECGAQNDVAARYCSECRAEIIDPNEKLKEVAAKIANDPYRLRIKEVESIQIRRWPGKDGKPDTLRVDYYIDESPHSVSQWLTPRISGQWFSVTPAIFGKVPSNIDEALTMQHNTPSRIAFRKNSSNRFFNVITVE